MVRKMVRKFPAGPRPPLAPEPQDSSLAGSPAVQLRNRPQSPLWTWGEVFQSRRQGVPRTSGAGRRTPRWQGRRTSGQQGRRVRGGSSTSPAAHLRACLGGRGRACSPVALRPRDTAQVNERADLPASASEPGTGLPSASAPPCTNSTAGLPAVGNEGGDASGE